MSRKVIIPQLIRLKECDKFIEQFIENLKDELNILIKDDNIKAIIENPSESEKIEKINECDKQLLYLYLASLHDGKYEQVLQVLLKDILKDNVKVVDRDTNASVVEKELLEYQNKCKLYEQKIEELKIVTKQRKEKINELELKLNIICDENEKTKKEKDKLLLEIQGLKTQIQNLNNIQCIQENKKSNEETCEREEKNYKVVIISNDNISIKNQNAVQMTQNEFLLRNEKERRDFEQICVYKKGIHISKLRKIMRLSGDKAIFFESTQEISRFIDAMEGENENRSY